MDCVLVHTCRDWKSVGNPGHYLGGWCLSQYQMVLSYLFSGQHEHKHDQARLGHRRRWAIQSQPQPDVFELCICLRGSLTTCQLLCNAGPDTSLHALADSMDNQARGVVPGKALWRRVFEAQKISTQMVVASGANLRCVATTSRGQPPG